MPACSEGMWPITISALFFPSVTASATYSTVSHSRVSPISGTSTLLSSRAWVSRWTCRAGTERDLRDHHLRIPDNAQNWRIEAFGDIAGEGLQGCLRQGEQVGIFGALKFLPAQSVDHARFDSVGLAHVPMIVKPPNDHAVLFDERALLRPDRITLIHAFRRIQVIVESRLMRDHEIVKKSGYLAVRLAIVFLGTGIVSGARHAVEDREAEGTGQAVLSRQLLLRVRTI